MATIPSTGSDRIRLIESNARLELLHHISHGITAGMSVKELVGRALGHLRESFPDLRIAYATIADSGEMTVMHSLEPAGMPGPGPSGLSFKAPASYLSALNDGKLMVVDDVLEDARVGEMVAVLGACGIRAMLGAPVHLPGRLMGVLSFDAASTRSWSRHEFETAKDVAGLLAVAIHNASLEEERKEAEVAVRESERKLQKIFDSITDVVWAIRADTKEQQYINPAVEAVCGRAPQEFMDNTEMWPRIIHPEDRDRVMAEFARLLRYGGTFDVQYRIVHVDGGIRWIHDRARAEQDEEGKVTHVDGTARDITSRKRLEAQLQESEKMESVGRLAGGLAHDFNNFLTAISGYTTLAVETLGGNSVAASHLQEIRMAAERASDLMRKLLGFARKQQISPRVVEINETIRGIQIMLRGFLGEDSELVLVLDDTLGRVRVDPTQIEQVLVNLIVNARDAMPSGGKVTIETANVAIEPDRRIDLLPGKYVAVSVRDTGTGILPADLPHIFEPFFTTKDVGKGTGLGLAASYGIIKQHGGHIDVASHLGFGTLFRILLPMVESKGAHAPLEARIEPAPRGRETILLAEDEPQVRELIRRVLVQLGYSVLEANDGEEALEVAGRHEGEIDLLLTDVVMPRMGGIDLAGRLKKGNPRIGLLYISGHAESALLTRGIAASAPVLAKPFFPDELAGHVRAVLDKRASPGRSE